MASNRYIMRKVMVPLDERARARLYGAGERRSVYCGYVSSGSEHETESVCLAGLVEEFMEMEEFVVGEAVSDQKLDSAGAGSEDEATDDESRESVEEWLRSRKNEHDPVRDGIYAAVMDAVLLEGGVKVPAKRQVMACLREAGFNAGICKTKWESSGGLTAGSYEFVDVLVAEGSSGGERRYIVELDLAGEFEIARPTKRYANATASLPKVFVGRTDELRQIVRSVAESAKKSMKSRGLHLPPWRRGRYMQAKWFGPYRRTSNSIPSSSSQFDPAVNESIAKLRSVGFDAGKCRPAQPFFISSRDRLHVRP